MRPRCVYPFIASGSDQVFVDFPYIFAKKSAYDPTLATQYNTIQYNTKDFQLTVMNLNTDIEKKRKILI